MLGHERAQCLEKVGWNFSPSHPRTNDHIVALECWRYEHVDHAIDGSNFRILNLVETYRPPDANNTSTENDVAEWLARKGKFAAPPSPNGAGRCEGGIRLLLVQRQAKEFGVTCSRGTFELVEKEFKLDAVTLPAFFTRGGIFSSSSNESCDDDTGVCCRIVVKACQKIEIGNYTLSLSHDSSSGWTTGLLCGNGVIVGNRHNPIYGSQFEQLKGALMSSVRLWNNPLLLPSVMLQIYAERIQTRAGRMDMEIVELESLIGITDIGRGVPPIGQKEWPSSVDSKDMTRILHHTGPQVSFMLSCCNWMQDHINFLSRLQLRLQERPAFRTRPASVAEIGEKIEFLQARANASKSFFDIAKYRIDSQFNLLFSVVGQQDSLLNRRDNVLNLLIANSTKQDSISMTTFTFITALFMPCTFVATLFSMTMFDWQPNGDGGGSGASSTATTTPTPQSYVSGQFWIYWTAAIPLSLLTMFGWYAWFRYANAKWSKDVNDAFGEVAASGADFASFMANPLARLDTKKTKSASSDATSWRKPTT